ncbi:MAG: type II secretion system F family protein [Acidimicrobiia bacterium]
MIEPARVLAVAVATAAAVGAVAWLVIRPLPRLAGRVRPYAPAARAFLGVTPAQPLSGPGIVAPIVAALGRGLSALIDATSDEELAARIDQAGLFVDLPAAARVGAHRQGQLRSFVVGLAAGALVGWALGWALAGIGGAAALGAVFGATRQRARLDKAIETRRERMRLEVYTVDQLLALRVRAGSGVLAAVGDVVARGQGVVVGELADALAAVRAGTRPADAFARLAATTAEPHCGRTYAALATAEERGSDLAVTLFALADDVRRARRELLRRRAVRRRAAMLVPIIALLAPVMLLFITAPLPRIVLGGL